MHALFANSLVALWKLDGDRATPIGLATLETVCFIYKADPDAVASELKDEVGCYELEMGSIVATNYRYDLAAFLAEDLND